MDHGSVPTGRAFTSSSPQATYDTSIGNRLPAKQQSRDHPDSGSRHRRWHGPSMKRAAAASPYEYRSDEEDILNSRIGIYGWRKRCLYLFEVCVAVIAILNLALLAWMTRIMDFSVDGMGTMRIHDDRVTMQGRSEFVSSLFAQSITSEQNEALRLLSNQGINITAGETYFLLGSKRVEAHAERFEIRDSNGAAYFVVTPSSLTASVESIILNSSRGATFQDFIQTKQLRGQAGDRLQVMSPSGDMTFLSGGKLSVVASGSGITMATPHIISLNAGSGNISMDTSNLLLPKLTTITSSTSSSAVAANVYEVCVCSGSGKLFLVSAQVSRNANSSNASPCSAGAGVC